ncbi:MAG: hypothetical protein LUE31_07500, partial [Lachnospiraceae bacterium]|nr:hypothetical protein [Lachnospiraceae bacterium]
MENHELCHHGILGQKWGIRRYQNADGTRTAAGKKREQAARKAEQSSTTTTTSVKDLSDDELKQKISRLELEKKYKDLTKEQKKVSTGKAFVEDVLKKSGSNIATQLTTYVMGTIINKAAGSDIVNPKKG